MRAWAALALKLAGSLSWKIAYHLGAGIGLLVYYLRIRRGVAMTNLDIVFGESKTKAEKEAIFRASMINFGRQVINYLRVPRAKSSFWRENFAIVNDHILHEAFREGRGVVLLASHFGAWELGAGAISAAGYPLFVVAKKLKNPVMDKILLGLREAMNLGTVGHRDTMKRILSGLKLGEGISMVVDQNMKRSQGVFAQWLGRTASSPRATAYIVRESGAAVIAGYARQLGPDRFELVVTERVEWEPHPEDPEKELQINTQKQLDAVQRYIYQAPENWFWLHRRWKVQPDGVKSPY